MYLRANPTGGDRPMKISTLVKSEERLTEGINITPADDLAARAALRTYLTHTTDHRKAADLKVILDRCLVSDPR